MIRSHSDILWRRAPVEYDVNYGGNQGSHFPASRLAPLLVRQKITLLKMQERFLLTHKLWTCTTLDRAVKPVLVSQTIQ